jgi:hypothetical protein
MLPARHSFPEVLPQIQTVAAGIPRHEIVLRTILAGTGSAYVHQNAGHQPSMNERLDLLW